jgi:hypothetical protein
MKLLEHIPGGYKFETSNGATWTREKLKHACMSAAIKGWTDTRELFLPDQSDAIFFPNATWRLSLTPSRYQEDPLFTTVPVRIKPGTKSVLQIFAHDGSVESSVRIKTLFDWN